MNRHINKSKHYSKFELNNNKICLLRSLKYLKKYVCHMYICL